MDASVSIRVILISIRHIFLHPIGKTTTWQQHEMHYCFAWCGDLRTCVLSNFTTIIMLLELPETTTFHIFNMQQMIARCSPFAEIFLLFTSINT